MPWNRFLGPSMLVGPAPSADELRPDTTPARALLSGVRRPLTLAVPPFCDECRAAADRVAGDLRAVGLQIDVRQVDASLNDKTAYRDFDMKIGAVWPDTPDRGAFLSQLLTVAIPTGWLSKPMQGVDAILARLAGPDRETRVTQLAALARDQVSAAVYGYSVHGAYLSRRLGCVDFWPTGELDLAALCRPSS